MNKSYNKILQFIFIYIVVRMLSDLILKFISKKNIIEALASNEPTISSDLTEEEISGSISYYKEKLDQLIKHGTDTQTLHDEFFDNNSTLAYQLEKAKRQPKQEQPKFTTQS